MSVAEPGLIPVGLQPLRVVAAEPKISRHCLAYIKLTYEVMETSVYAGRKLHDSYVPRPTPDGTKLWTPFNLPITIETLHLAVGREFMGMIEHVRVHDIGPMYNRVKLRNEL